MALMDEKATSAVFQGRARMSAALSLALGLAALALGAPAQSAIVVTPTTSPGSLGLALAGTGVTITNVRLTNGDSAQVATYSNFNAGPVRMSDGVVLSTGRAIDTALPPTPGEEPSTNTTAAGTPEFDNYAFGRVENFFESFDVARLQVDFVLALPSAVSFDFSFGSIEYPVFTSNYTDAFLAFVDGLNDINQVVFDANGQPVQVGQSFAELLTTGDENTTFAGEHGLIGRLTTTTGVLSAGAHSLYFLVGDVNDGILDSAVFLTNLRASELPAGTVPAVPLPAAAWLMLSGLGAVGAFGKKWKLQKGAVA